jgi:hypothetical protein
MPKEYMMPVTDRKTKFQLTLMEFGVPEVATEQAWGEDSWVEATKTIRFAGKHCRALPEIRAMFYAALDLPKHNGEEHWDDVARAWHGRKGKK